MSLEKDIQLLNVANDNDVLSLIVGALISADSLVSIDTCVKSTDIINGFIKALPHTNIDNKDEWMEKFETCLDIITRAKKELEG